MWRDTVEDVLGRQHAFGEIGDDWATCRMGQKSRVPPGKWAGMIVALTCQDIARRLNLRRSARSWRGDCPACSYAGTFSMKEGRNGKPQLFCASCGDPTSIARALGQPLEERQPKRDEDQAARQSRMKEAALRLWRGSEPAWRTPAMTYLASRHIDLDAAQCGDLRFRSDCPHPEGGTLPAMIALIRDSAGEPCAIHRTYLRRDGDGKATVVPAKATLGPYWGGAVRLAPVATEVIVGEGLETAFAAGILTGLPPWAAIAAGNLATGLVLPVGVRSVVIAVDRDPAGEQAAAAAATRWRAEGRHVRLLLPDQPGQDAADVLRARRVHNA